jgi:hypothetical protein
MSLSYTRKTDNGKELSVYCHKEFWLSSITYGSEDKKFAMKELAINSGSLLIMNPEKW